MRAQAIKKSSYTNLARSFFTARTGFESSLNASLNGPQLSFPTFF